MDAVLESVSADLVIEQSRGPIAKPSISEPGVAPAPHPAEVQKADKYITIVATVDGTPEEDEGGVVVRLLLPLLGDGVGGASR